jgi:hypothetical protein
MSDRQAGGCEFTVGVVTGGAFVGVAEQRAVGPLEVEHQTQRFAGLHVRKRGAAGVHEQTLALGRDLMRNLRLDHVATAYRGEVVAVGPVLRLMLDVDVELANLERFEGDVAVAVELDFHAIEVVLAAIDRQILAPVILDPFEDQLPTRRHRSDAVRAAAQWRFEGGGLEVAVFPVVLWQHRQFTETQDQQRIARALEHEANALFVENVDAQHFLQGGAVQRMTVLEQRSIGERHVEGGDRVPS